MQHPNETLTTATFSKTWQPMRVWSGAMENTRNVKSPRVCDGERARAVVNCDQNTEWPLMKRGRRRPTGRGGEGGERYRKAAHRRRPRRLQASGLERASGTNVRMGFNGPRHIATTRRGVSRGSFLSGCEPYIA